MKIALVQFSPAWENPEASKEKIYELLARTDIHEIDLIIFPELTLTGFTMNTKKFAEEIDGASFRFFIDLAMRHKIHVIGGVIERSENGTHNTLLHISREGLIAARYEKIHPFSFSNEDKFFAAGKEPVLTTIEKVKFGLTICYDLRFPELYRIYALKGAEVIVNIANWPTQRVKHWDLLLKANAVFSQSIIIGVNRTGEDPYYKYNGHSAVILPDGEAIGQTDETERILIFDAPTERTGEYREKFPFLRDTKLLKF